MRHLHDRHASDLLLLSFFFFFNDPATTEIYTLSLHDALPILPCGFRSRAFVAQRRKPARDGRSEEHTSELQSHSFISYAVFCLKKNKKYTVARNVPLFDNYNERPVTGKPL